MSTSQPAGSSLSGASRSALVARLRAAGCVFAEDEAEQLIAAATGLDQLAGLVERRVSGEPLEHVLGWVEFCGLRITVGPGVFVPRRRTELLVCAAVQAARRDRPVIVVDLCCGCGAIGAAVASRLSAVELYASDLDPAAVRCARGNLAGFGGQVFHGDLFDPLPGSVRGRVGLLLANVPYVPTDEIVLLPVEAREHEPRLALDGGPDGLDVLRRVAGGAVGWLAPGGQLLVEISRRQEDPAVAAFVASGLATRVTRSQELGTVVVIGARPPSGSSVR